MKEGYNLGFSAFRNVTTLLSLEISKDLTMKGSNLEQIVFTSKELENFDGNTNIFKLYNFLLEEKVDRRLSKRNSLVFASICCFYSTRAVAFHSCRVVFNAGS